jgi:hypothetical protein
MTKSLSCRTFSLNYFLCIVTKSQFPSIKGSSRFAWLMVFLTYQSLSSPPLPSSCNIYDCVCLFTVGLTHYFIFSASSPSSLISLLIIFCLLSACSSVLPCVQVLTVYEITNSTCDFTFQATALNYSNIFPTLGTVYFVQSAHYEITQSQQYLSASCLHKFQLLTLASVLATAVASYSL